MAPALSLSLGAAACLLPTIASADPIVTHLDSCASQNACISWAMTPSETGCTADPVLNAAGDMSCTGMWKVCMTIHKKGPGKEACPEALVRYTCPDDSCPGASADPIKKPKQQCHIPSILPVEDYCQYGKPGEVLKFFVQDGDGCAGATGPSPEWPAAHTDKCQATVKCHAAEATEKSCRSDCTGKDANTPCVHEFTVPSECGCEATTKTTEAPTEASTTKVAVATTSGEVESMEPANGAAPALGLAASAAGPAAMSSSVLAMVSALAVASAAAVGGVVYRRLRAAPGAELARDMPLEGGLPE